LWNLALGAKGGWHDEQGQLRWRAGFVLAFLLLLFTGCIFLPLTGAGFFGSQLVTGTLNTVVSLSVVGISFGFLYIFTQNWLALRSVQKDAEAESAPASAAVHEERLQKRRGLLLQGLTVLGLGALGIIAWRFISGAGNASSTPQAALNNYQRKITPPPKPNYGNLAAVQNLSPEVTTNDQFYVVSKNLVSDPNVNGNTWQLTVDGLVAQPYTLNYSALLAQPMQKQYETLECISNQVGGNYMSNALWEGVQLAHLLAKAGGVQKGNVQDPVNAPPSPDGSSGYHTITITVPKR
jgi:Oxidoreductase molybdopterin binding domain